MPAALMRHLIERVDEREITFAQLGKLSIWLETPTEVPEGKWFKRFPGFAICGEGELIKTFLRSGQVPTGEEVF